MSPYTAPRVRIPPSPLALSGAVRSILEMDRASRLAWAAGLFDGEGSASTYLPRERFARRRQMQVSQAGVVGELPAVLVRFREALGSPGNITGPYRGYLYYWKTTRGAVIDEVSTALWPYLSREKRGQLARAALDVGATVPVGSASSWSPQVERAWAAGLFDGEGSVVVVRRRGSDHRGLQLYLSQSHPTAPPETITRFHSAVGELGTLSGPHPPRSPWSRLPQYHWQANGRHVVSGVVRLLWPWLAPVMRHRIVTVSDLLDPGTVEGVELGHSLPTFRGR